MANVTRIGGKDVLFVMAAQAEYGSHLQKLFTPLMTGVGPVEAAVRLGAWLRQPARQISIAAPLFNIWFARIIWLASRITNISGSHAT